MNIANTVIADGPLAQDLKLEEPSDYGITTSEITYNHYGSCRYGA